MINEAPFQGAFFYAEKYLIVLSISPVKILRTARIFSERLEQSNTSQRTAKLVS